MLPLIDRVLDEGTHRYQLVNTIEMTTMQVAAVIAVSRILSPLHAP